MSSTSIHLAWSPPSPELQNGIVRNYMIRVIEVETEQTMDFEVNGSDSTHLISSLHPYYTYQCSIAAVTVGAGPPGHTVVITKEEGE